jgi:hypothetical protein
MPGRSADNKAAVRKRRMGPKDKAMAGNSLVSSSSKQEMRRPLLDSSDGEEQEQELKDVVAGNSVQQSVKLEDPEEAAWQIAVQVFIPYLVAGSGMVMAGLVLDIVQVRVDIPSYLQSLHSHTFILRPTYPCTLILSYSHVVLIKFSIDCTAGDICELNSETL